MRVKFECEKCGTVLREYEPVVDAFYVYQRESDYPCPNCAKLSYGPLTEEMTAEALFEAEHIGMYWEWERAVPDVQESYLGMARFVLRLLQEVKDWWKPIDQFKLKDTNWEYWRDWLLELARKP